MLSFCLGTEVKSVFFKLSLLLKEVKPENLVFGRAIARVRSWRSRLVCMGSPIGFGEVFSLST